MRVARAAVGLIVGVALFGNPTPASADLRDTAERAARAAAASLKPQLTPAPQVARAVPSASSALLLAMLRGAVLAPAESRRARRPPFSLKPARTSPSPDHAPPTLDALSHASL
jgi:hypothetical protein